MFEKIKSLFNKKEIKKEVREHKSNEKPIEEYFQEELNNCPYIKKEYHEIVMADLLHKEKMTKEVKQSIFNEQGLSIQNPSRIVTEIYNRSTITKLRHDNFKKSIKAGIKKFTLMACGDQSECAWCKENIGKEMGINILEIMEKNCQCKPYSKCVIQPVIEFN